MDEGIFYARSIPKSSKGAEGKTDIHLVGADKDKILDSYNWYSRHTLVLSWSPIAGKVAVLKYDPENKTAALSFYIGGKFLKSYSHNDLKAFGVTSIVEGCGTQMDLRIVGQEQVPGTNKYVFKVDFLSAKVKRFDIMTGDLVN